MKGESGFDVLVGGTGHDRIYGGFRGDLLIGGSLFADWEPESDLSGIDAAMATWVSGDLAATVDALGGVEDDDECDWLFGGWGHDSFVLGNGDYWS